MIEINKNEKGKLIFEINEINDIINEYKLLKTPKKIGEKYGCGEKVIVRVLKENNVQIRKKTTKYTINEDVFNCIDTEDKAYWIGFIWCDGYNCKRTRGNSISYEFKLSLMSSDINHLNKLKKFLNSTHKIYEYDIKNNKFKANNKECRLLISNTNFGKMLDDEYGLISNRFDCSKLLANIPSNLMKHFIRGVLDAEGSIVYSTTHDKSRIKNGGKEIISEKLLVSINTYENLINYINDYLYETNIVKNKSKIYTRHNGEDGYCRSIVYCGNKNAFNLLNWLYQDSNIYLDRKYLKYIDVKNKLNQC